MRRTLLPLSLITLAACTDYASEDGRSDLATYDEAMDWTDEAPDAHETGDTAMVLDQCDVLEDTVLYLSPDDSNSMTSPMLTKATQEAGFGVYGARAYEFMNYYHFDYEAPSTGGTVALDAQMVENDGRFALQIGVTSETVSMDERDPVNLTFVVDNSCSMDGDPLEMSKASIEAIASVLDEGDTISLLTWNTSSAALLDSHAVSGPDDPDVLAAVRRMRAQGSTDLHGGLVDGYELATANYDADAMNRVILVSDGGANAGITSIDVISNKAEGFEDGEGIYMMGIGTGSGASGYNDYLMDAVTDAGKGAAVFIADREQAERVFVDDFLSTFDVAVENVRLELTLPPGFTIVRSSAEEISTDPEAVREQHLAPNDSMVFYNELATACPDEVTPTAAVTARVTFTHDGEDLEVEQTWRISDLIAEDAPELRKGEAIFAVTEFLNGNIEASDARSTVDNAMALLPDDTELIELRAMIR